MLTKIIIEKLFDKFDYTIELKPEGITILTGPNGYGKTTVLKILDSLAKQDARFFIQLPLEKISLEFSDAPLIIFSREENDEMFIEINGRKQELIASHYKSRKGWRLSEHDISLLRHIEQQYPNLRRADKQRLIDRNSGQQTFTEDESFQEDVLRHIEQRYPNLTRINDNTWVNENTRESFTKDDLFQKCSLDLSSLRDVNVPEVYFIRAQRLLHSSSNLNAKNNTFKNAVEEYARDLSSRIEKFLSKSSEIARELDSSFPRRLFNQETKISEVELNNRFDKVKEIQKTLGIYNLYDFIEDNHPVYRVEDARALAVYIEDTEKKLAVFDELLEKLNLFTEILNERRFTFKQIHISRYEGFTLSTDDGKPLRLQDLSSGEQQEVVMLYELLFLVQPNTLVLIDEPELSLHVVWQQEFLKDLEKIVTWKKIQVIIATHSPQIINERWDLVVDLWDLHHAKHTG